MKQVFINGTFCDLADEKIPIFDRGFLFGDAVYEVLPVYNSQPFFVEKHLNTREVWITSTTKKIFPVIQIDKHIINDGKMGDYCLTMNNYYKKLVAND